MSIRSTLPVLLSMLFLFNLSMVKAQDISDLSISEQVEFHLNLADKHEKSSKKLKNIAFTTGVVGVLLLFGASRADGLSYALYGGAILAGTSLFTYASSFHHKILAYQRRKYAEKLELGLSYQPRYQIQPANVGLTLTYSF